MAWRTIVYENTATAARGWVTIVPTVVQINSIETSLVSSLIQTAKKIHSFGTLAPGWHYGSGGPIPKPTRDLAQEVLISFAANGFRRTNAFAGENMEILVCAYHGDHYLAVIIEPDLTMSFRHEINNVDRIYAEGMDKQQVKDAIAAARGEIWSSLGSSIQTISTGKKNVSMTFPLNALKMEACL
jgi:hypothetical protein